MNLACAHPRIQTTSTFALHRRGPSLVRAPLVALVAASLVQACHSSSPLGIYGTPLEVYGAPAGTFSIAVGQELVIQMGTVGPGEYGSPPTLNGSTIAFLGETSPPGVPVPSGVRQIFHFMGVAGGRTIITFQNTDPDKTRHPDVSDTVVVR